LVEEKNKRGEYFWISLHIEKFTERLHYKHMNKSKFRE